VNQLPDSTYTITRPITAFDRQAIIEAVALFGCVPHEKDDTVMRYLLMLCDKAKSVIEDRPLRDLPSGVALSSVPTDVADLIAVFDALGCKNRHLERPPSSFDSILYYMQWHVVEMFHGIGGSIHSSLQAKWAQTGSWG
jgi:hypothetical protein